MRSNKWVIFGYCAMLSASLRRLLGFCFSTNHKLRKSTLLVFSSLVAVACLLFVPSSVSATDTYLGWRSLARGTWKIDSNATSRDIEFDNTGYYQEYFFWNKTVLDKRWIGYLMADLNQPITMPVASTMHFSFSIVVKSSTPFIATCPSSILDPSLGSASYKVTQCDVTSSVFDETTYGQVYGTQSGSTPNGDIVHFPQYAYTSVFHSVYNFQIEIKALREITVDKISLNQDFLKLSGMLTESTSYATISITSNDLWFYQVSDDVVSSIDAAANQSHQDSQAQIDATNKQTEQQNQQYEQDKQEESDRENQGSEDADKASGMFSFTFLNPFIGIFELFNSSGCVQIPTIASWVNANDSTYCPWFSQSVRDVLTPVFGMSSMMLLFGFAIGWLNGNDANGTIEVKS